MRTILASLIFLLAGPLLAQTAGVPKEKIPDALLNQVRLIEADFVVALQKDCSGNVCYPRGCVYVSHEIVSMQGDRVLPGLDNEKQVPSEPQYILTGVACEYAHENGLAKEEVSNLNRRLESKLSKGALRINLKAVEIPAAAIKPSLATAAEPTWGQKLLDQFFLHFSWLLGTLLLLVLVTIVIWAWRRLGRDTKEEELRFLLYRQRMEADAARGSLPVAVESPFDESKAWAERLQRLQLAHDKNPEILRARLQLALDEGQLGRVACSLALLAAAAESPLPSERQGSLVSLQLGEFMQGYVPSATEQRDVLQDLEQQLSLKAHFDASLLVKVRQLFNRYDAVALLAQHSDLEARRALLALAPGLKIRELVDALPAMDVQTLAQSFCQSPRVSSRAVELWLQREGASGLDPRVTQECDASWILGFLLGRLAPAARAQVTAGTQRAWIAQAFYADCLSQLTRERAQDVLLSVDGQSLVHWYSFLSSDEQTLVLDLLPASYQAQMRQLPRIDAAVVTLAIKTMGREAARSLRRGA